MVKRTLVLLGLILALLAPAAAASTPESGKQAGGACFWTREPVYPSTTQRLRCQCGDNVSAPWRLCLKQRR